jgi:hypothetical protein
MPDCCAPGPARNRRISYARNSQLLGQFEFVQIAYYTDSRYATEIRPTGIVMSEFNSPIDGSPDEPGLRHDWVLMAACGLGFINTTMNERCGGLERIKSVTPARDPAHLSGTERANVPQPQQFLFRMRS